MAQSRTASPSTWPLLALTGVEWRIGRRTAVFRFLAAAAFLLGWSVGAAPGRGAGMSAYTAAETAWQYIGFIAVVWVSVVAVREGALRTDLLVLSKPQPNERLLLAKFMGIYIQLLCVLLALFVGSMCGRLASGGGLLGAEAYAPQYLRAAAVLFFAASTSYTLTLLLENAIAGALVGLYWILTLAGKSFLGKFYFPAYSQNLGAFLALGLGLLCLTLLVHRRARRGSAQPALWIRIGAPAFCLLACWLFWTVIRDGHDPHARLNPALERMGEQDIEVGVRAAGFLLPDQHGRMTGLSDFTGKILVIGLWSPHDPDSALLLDRLDEVQRRFGAQGVQSVAISLSEDHGAASTFALGEHVSYPVVLDWGTNSAQEASDSSPLANAYRARSLPSIYVTDRRRRVVDILTGSDSYDGAALDTLVAERLSAEPK